MKEIKNYIKKKTKVYSLEYGAGEIIGILKLYDGIEDYIEVEFFANGGEVKIFPYKFENDLRIISNPIELTCVLESLNSKIAQPDYSKVADSFQKFGLDMNLEVLINTIASMVGRFDLRSLDKTLLAKCINSLILEVGHVYEINEKRAKGVVSDYLRAA